MSEKPGKRLVSWKQYLVNISKKAFFNGTASGLFCIGVISVLMTILCLVVFVFDCGTPLDRHGEVDDLLPFKITSTWAAIGIFATLTASTLLRRAKRIEPVSLITRHNTGDLPEVETLVRASDLPPSHQQAELLRAVKPGQETPPEELLRAGRSSCESDSGE